MDWEYRIIKYEEGDEIQYCIEEVMVDSDGVVQSHTIEYSPICKSVDELKDNLVAMEEALHKPILGSFPSIRSEGQQYD